MQKNLLKLSVLIVASFAGFVSQSSAEDKAPVGYTDTPMLPSGKWHVHDPARPAPPVVTPGATFSDSWNGSGVSEQRIMETADIAKIILAASQLSPQACVEDIILRPQLGDI